jgi:hypothetical protein
VVQMLVDRGFEVAGVVPVLGGLLAIHHARKSPNPGSDPGST